MSDLLNDNSDLEENQGGENDQPGNEELAKIQAQLSASSSEARLVNEVNKVVLSEDFSYFQDLLRKDKAMSEKVIDKIASMKGLNADEVRELLMKDAKPQTLSPYDVEKQVKEALEKQEGEKALEQFINETGLNKDKALNEEFLSNFNDYMEGKAFTLSNVKKFSKSAYRDLNEDKVKSFEKKKDEISAQINSGGSSKQQEKKSEGRQLLKGGSQNDW